MKPLVYSPMCMVIFLSHDKIEKNRRAHVSNLCVLHYSPLLDGHFLSTFHPQMRYLYHFKALVAGNSNIWSIGSSMECHEIITKHFFSCPSSWREFWHFFCLFIFRCRVSRQNKKNCEFFWHFWKLNGYLLFWTFGHLYGTPLMMMPIISLNSPFSANNFKW